MLLVHRSQIWLLSGSKRAHDQMMVRKLDLEIAEALISGNGVMSIRDFPAHIRSLERRVTSGQLTRVLPTVLVDSERSLDLEVLARALLRWRPDAVITGQLAAQLSFWPESQTDTVTASVPSRVQGVTWPYRLTTERLDPSLVNVINGIRVAAPSFTAIDLAAHDGGAAIDEVLRRRLCTLEDLQTALELTPRRRGNRTRHTVLWASRAEPWSQAERRAHRILRDGRVTGWVTNHLVRCGDSIYYLDIAFIAERVAVEVDGYDAHSKRGQFHDDRRRWTNLQVAGWLIVHLTWEQLEDSSWVLTQIRRLRELSKSRPQRTRRPRDTREH